MRQPKKRTDYGQDIATLHRIARLVKDDERIPVEGREAVVTDLHRAIKRLMSFELASIDDDDDGETGASLPAEPSVEPETTPPSVEKADGEEP